MARPRRPHRFNGNREEKQCPKCHEWKTLDEFSIDKTKFDQLKCACKTCDRQAVAVSSWNVKIKVLDAYGGCCAVCGIINPQYLSIDHINDNGAEHRRKIGVSTGSHFYLWLKKHNYPPGYQILCHNHNGAKQYYPDKCDEPYKFAEPKPL